MTKLPVVFPIEEDPDGSCLDDHFIVVYTMCLRISFAHDNHLSCETDLYAQWRHSETKESVEM